ncbi:MAG: hypothetical protein JW772_01900 [Candidatus Diapherotrites archaeon]|nr:hypothetical protein [Candidatus Diapherotrites archaeon]
MKELPLLVSLDHNDESLKSQGRRVIHDFGEKGKTLFIEGTAKSITQRNSSAKPFFAALQEARKIGMGIVFLDARTEKALVSKRVKRSFKIPQPDFQNYLTFNLREREWIKTIRKQAKRGDIVMVHQNHAKNLLDLDPLLGGNFLAITRLPITSSRVSKADIEWIRYLRAKKRPLVKRKPGALKRKPEVPKKNPLLF